MSSFQAQSNFDYWKIQITDPDLDKLQPIGFYQEKRFRFMVAPYDPTVPDLQDKHGNKLEIKFVFKNGEKHKTQSYAVNRVQVPLKGRYV